MEAMRVVVGGGGTLGRRVTKYVSEKHDVTMIEKDLARYQAMTEAFAGWQEVTVLLGDIDEPAVLLEAGVDRADVFVAATGDDEDNLVGCLLAKNEFKVKKVIGTVRNPRNRWLYNRSWGVDVAIDAAQIVTRIIEEEATLTDLVRLLDLREGEVTLTALTATEGGNIAGKTFQQLGVPEGCYPVALLRGTELVMPSPDVRIEVGDALLVLAGPGGSCRIDTFG
jgi:trk/ktr system potassium uptake protein